MLTCDSVVYVHVQGMVFFMEESGIIGELLLHLIIMNESFLTWSI